MSSLSVGENLGLRFVKVSIDNHHNKPTAEEIARVFRSIDGEQPGHRHIVAH